MGVISNLGNLVPADLPESRPSARKAGAKPGEDQAQLATVPLSAQVEQIHGTDPSNFQAVLSDAIHKLKVAAADSSDPAETAYLLAIADRFQQLAEANNAGTFSGSAGDP